MASWSSHLQVPRVPIQVSFYIPPIKPSPDDTGLALSEHVCLITPSATFSDSSPDPHPQVDRRDNSKPARPQMAGHYLVLLSPRTTPHCKAARSKGAQSAAETARPLKWTPRPWALYRPQDTMTLPAKRHSPHVS